MNNEPIAVYDFDKTVYYSDSTMDYWRYLAPKLKLWKRLPGLIFPAISYYFGKMSAGALKKRFFSFLKGMSESEIVETANRFWDGHISKINPYFYETIKEEKSLGYTAICISASPTFLLEKVTRDLGFDVFIGTRFETVNGYFTGELAGPNCKGEEKVIRLNDYYQSRQSSYTVKRFYSDSRSDMPLYRLAERKFAVRKGKLFEGLP